MTIPLINKEALKVCRERGHDGVFLERGWTCCKYCGIWVREIRTIEEREDKPPQKEISLLEGLKYMEGIE